MSSSKYHITLYRQGVFCLFFLFFNKRHRCERPLSLLSIKKNMDRIRNYGENATRIPQTDVHKTVWARHTHDAHTIPF